MCQKRIVVVDELTEGAHSIDVEVNVLLIHQASVNGLENWLKPAFWQLNEGVSRHNFTAP